MWQFCNVVTFSELNEEAVVLVQIVAQNKVKGVLLRWITLLLLLLLSRKENRFDIPTTFKIKLRIHHGSCFYFSSHFQFIPTHLHLPVQPRVIKTNAEVATMIMVGHSVSCFNLNTLSGAEQSAFSVWGGEKLRRIMTLFNYNFYWQRGSAWAGLFYSRMSALNLKPLPYGLTKTLMNVEMTLMQKNVPGDRGLRKFQINTTGWQGVLISFVCPCKLLYI